MPKQKILEKCEKLKKRKDVFGSSPRANSKPKALQKALEDNYSRRIFKYSYEAIAGLVDEVCEGDFHYTDILLNSVNLNDRPYKLIYEKDDSFFFITPETIRNAKIIITWKPRRATEALYVGYNQGGKYVWELSEIQQWAKRLEQ